MEHTESTEREPIHSFSVLSVLPVLSVVTAMSENVRKCPLSAERLNSAGWQLAGGPAVRLNESQRQLRRSDIAARRTQRAGATSVSTVESIRRAPYTAARQTLATETNELL